MKFFLFCLLLLLIFLPSCKSSEEEKRIVKEQPVFLAVRIWGEEEKEAFSCLVQVQNRDDNAAPRSLKPGERVFINNIGLEADSAKYSGVFYQAELPVEQFSGKQTIAFTDLDGRNHSDTFFFRPFSLINEPGETAYGNGLILTFSGLPAGETTLNLLITDTAYATDDINILATVRDGKMEVSPSLLSTLRKGPVMLQVIREDEKMLLLGRNRGKLLLSYSLTREFILN